MAYIVVEGADFPRQTITLSKPFSLGRVEGNDLVIRSAMISRRHVRFEPTNQGWKIIDAGSTSGFYLNEERGGESRELADGDEIRVGDVRIRFYQQEPIL